MPVDQPSAIRRNRLDDRVRSAAEEPMSTPAPAPSPDKPKPAVEQGPAVRRPQQIGATLLGGWTARLLMIATGAGFVVGFFMPWITLGNAAQVSGLGLLTTSGDVVDLVSGPY